MPKKTRQEKILAELHRLQEQQKKAQSLVVQAVKESQPTLNLQSLKSSETPVRVAETNYSYVFSDLRKTAIFAVLALVFQIILSVALAKGSIFG